MHFDSIAFFSSLTQATFVFTLDVFLKRNPRACLQKMINLDAMDFCECRLKKWCHKQPFVFTLDVF